MGLWRAYLCPTMAKPKTAEEKNYKIVAENRRARFDYAIEEDIECGIMLEGSEVKSLRTGKAQIAESYAAVEDGELWLVNSYVPPYEQAKTFQHDERRRRKLLVNKRELAKLWSATQREGMTLVPLVLYFNHKGRAKLKIGIAKGKKLSDKRETSAKRDWQRQKARLMKDHG
ncbi:SsrA-binding protein [Litoreibacter roseus]|uniref:SsrA-binding protein n=2 Tax=Litoreibacter roseus TaxID=2601869 RepID=A0A6N6JFS2_9RHOB|nr:SsrA-binding protein [Litoreibacter roseus]